jgi:hypothetical protein
MQRDVRAFLWDVQQAADTILQFIAGLDVRAYAETELVHSAVERKFEIIGEALGQIAKLDPVLARRIPDMMPLAMWFSPTTLPGYITGVIAAVVAFISYKNWRVSRDKLKLDLYNRRFAVYVSALDCIQDVFNTYNPETEKRILLLIRSTRESLFLFDKRDRVFEVLQALREYCQNWATIHKAELEPVELRETNTVQLSMVLRNDPKNSVLRAEQLLTDLEIRLHGYMSFGSFK